MIIDDEKILSLSLQKKLEHSGYNVTVLHSYNSFLRRKITDIDLYIIDIALWDGSGFDIIKNIRSKPSWMNVPILLMSGHGNVKTKVTGLDIWADDYIVKPFHPDEMLARIRALMKRAGTTIHNWNIVYKNISLNTSSRSVTKWWKQVDLTKKEKRIFEFFIRNQERLVTKNEIVEKLWWKRVWTTTDNTINVTICNLRKKLWTHFKLETKLWEWYILLK